MRRTRAAQRGHAPDAGVLTALASERSSISSVIGLPTAPGLPLQGNGDFGTSAFFGQLSDKPLLACIWSHGVRTPKRNGWWKIKRWAPSWRIAVVQLINWFGAPDPSRGASGCFNCCLARSLRSFASIDCYVLELNAEVGGDHGAARKDGNILEHCLAAIAEATG
jgi:hypothetical protein